MLRKKILNLPVERNVPLFVLWIPRGPIVQSVIQWAEGGFSQLQHESHQRFTRAFLDICNVRQRRFAVHFHFTFRDRHFLAELQNFQEKRR